MVLLKNVKNFTKHYDIIVIGAGAGLGKLGRPATEYGYSVALCENDKLGGTCLNRGCIPSVGFVITNSFITFDSDLQFIK